MDYVPLFTSIPPLMNRKDHNGLNFGIEYQRKCLKSWVDAGFKVYSINSVNESLPEHLEGLISVKRVDRDAFEQTGKHLLHLQDIMAVIGETVQKGAFAITNADIFFTDDNVLSNTVRSLMRGECLIEHRYDVDDIRKSEGEIYKSGYDFFSFNVDDISKLQCDGLVFGVPWWDHALPINALLAGLARKRVGRPLVYHLKHEERWNIALWVQFGEKFINSVVFKADAGSNATVYNKRFRDEVERTDIYAGFNLVSVKNFLEKVGLLTDHFKKKCFLMRLSKLNGQIIDKW